MDAIEPRVSQNLYLSVLYSLDVPSNLMLLDQQQC